MNIELLTQHINSAGLFPVRVEFTHDQNADMQVLGSFDDYLAAVKSLQSPVIFIGTFELMEEHFICESDDDSFEEDEEVDLCKIQPELKKYSSKIGETGWFQLAAPMRNGSLTFNIKEEWWIQFHELLSAAKESVEEERNCQDPVDYKLSF